MRQIPASERFWFYAESELLQIRILPVAGQLIVAEVEPSGEEELAPPLLG